MKSLLPPRSDPQLERPAGERAGKGGGSFCGTKEGLRPTLMTTSHSLFFKLPPHVGRLSTAPVLVGGDRVLREGHSATPHCGGGEGDQAVDPKVGGFWL